MLVIPTLLSTLIKTLLYDEVNAESAFVDSLELIPNHHNRTNENIKIIRKLSQQNYVQCTIKTHRIVKIKMRNILNCQFSHYYILLMKVDIAR